MWWPAQKTLLVADTHFSKDAIFRQHGIAIPAGSVQRDLQRLTALLEQTTAQRLIILGDFVHGRISADDPFLGEFARWQEQHHEVHIDIITGNHDRHLDKGLFKGVHWHGSLTLEPFCLQHEPDQVADQYVLAGHVHPVMRLQTGRHDRIRLPVLVCGKNTAILPSFGTMTGGFNIKPKQGDRVFVFGEGEVLQVQ